MEMDPLQTLLNSAYSKAKKGEYQAALVDFDTVLSHNPNHAGALYGVAACYFRNSNPRSALEYVHRLLRLRPDHPEGIRLLNEIRIEGLKTHGWGELREDSINPEAGSIDPFGTGIDKKSREVEIIPEWRSPGRDVPSIRETLLEGKGTCSSPFQVRKAYRDAWKRYRENFRKLFAGTWIALFLGVGLLAPFASWMFEGLVGGSLFSPGRILVLILLYPTVGIFSCYCYRLRQEGQLPLTEIVRFAGYYPIILICLGWMLVPIPIILSAIYGLSLLVQSFLDLPLSTWVLFQLPYLGGAILFYLWWRCWFLHQAIFDNPDLHPLTILGRAYFATSGQQLRLIVFSLFQTVLLILGGILFGWGIPIVHLAQAEAFLQTQKVQSHEVDEIGFIPKTRRVD